MSVYQLLLFDRLNPELPKNFNFYERNNSGLCDQLFSLVNGIMKSNKKYVIIDCFNYSIENGTSCPVSKVIDLELTTKELRKIPGFQNIQLLDRYKSKLEIIQARYGTADKNIDVLNKMKSYQNNDLTNMNLYFGKDPEFGVKKSLSLVYKLNDEIIEDQVTENTKLHRYNTEGYDNINEVLFNNMMKAITFVDPFYQIADQMRTWEGKTTFINLKYKNKIESLSHENKMDVEEYERKLYVKIQYLIDMYTDKENVKCLLTDNTETKNNFNTLNQSDKNFLLINYLKMTGSELYEIIDLILCLKYSNVYIGSNYDNRSRSLFSYIVANNTNCLKVLIDLSNIHSAEKLV